MIRFSKYYILYIVISALVLVPGIVSLIVNGLRPAVDFTGGTLLEVSFEQQIDKQDIATKAGELEMSLVSVQTSGKSSYVLRFKPEDEIKMNQFISSASALQNNKMTVLRNETVGPTLGKELFQKTITATIFAIVMILLYIAYSFKSFKYGGSAIVALIHDFFIVIGSFSLFGKFLNVEVDTLFVTAVLTTMSFSVHDTIVVFDRIRERLKLKDRADFRDICDAALTETMGRSLVNSFTIIFMLLALVLMGGETVKWFVIALLIGTVAGTYSSPFVATQFLIFWDKMEKR